MKWAPQDDDASPVVMLRSLPKGTTEQDLVRWAESFVYELRDAHGRKTGSIRNAACVKALVLHDKLLGFVQFDDIWAARRVMTQFIHDPPSIFLQRPDGNCHLLNLVYSDKPEIRAQNKGRAAPLPPPVYANTRLILVVLKELREAVTIDHLFWTFTQIACVEKVSSFTKDNKNQLVVQFQTPEGAASAMSYFQNKYLPATDSDSPLCFLAIVPSTLEYLTFRNQDGRNRDYTAVNQMIKFLMQSQAAIARDKDAANIEWAQLCSQSTAQNSLPDFVWGQHRWGEGWLSPRQDEVHKGIVPALPSPSYTQGKLGECMHISGLPSDDSIGAYDLFRICFMYGEVRAVKMLYKYRGCAVVQFSNQETCANAIKYLHALEYKSKTWDAKVSRQPNAMHWNGASDGLQKRMCSSSDPACIKPPISEHSARTAPARSARLWDVPVQVSERDVVAALQEHNVCPVSMARIGMEVVIYFETRDDGVTAAVMANGATAQSPTYGEWKIKFRFWDPQAEHVPQYMFKSVEELQRPAPVAGQGGEDLSGILSGLQGMYMSPDGAHQSVIGMPNVAAPAAPHWEAAAAAAAAVAGEQPQPQPPQAEHGEDDDDDLIEQLSPNDPPVAPSSQPPSAGDAAGGRKKKPLPQGVGSLRPADAAAAASAAASAEGAPPPAKGGEGQATTPADTQSPTITTPQTAIAPSGRGGVSAWVSEAKRATTPAMNKSGVSFMERVDE